MGVQTPPPEELREQPSAQGQGAAGPPRADGMAMSEAMYRELFEQASDGFMIVDKQGCCADVNQAVCALVGYTREELQSRPLSQLLMDGDAARWPTMLGELLRGGVLRAEWLLRHKGGAAVPVEVKAKQFDGGMLQLLLRDIRDRRTAELLRMQHAERLAAVGSLMAQLAHEIRNPLNAALLQLKVLMIRVHQYAPAAEREVTMPATAIQMELDRLTKLLKEFLELAGPAGVGLVPTKVGPILERVFELLSPDAAAGRVTMNLLLEPDLPSVMADPSRLEQAVTNLLQNAVDACVEVGGGRVQLRAHRGPTGLVVEVEDNGGGIRASPSRIFQPFYTTKRKGTGLGLSIVDSIVSQHHGDIHVDSQPGRTVFSMRLPT